MRATAVFDILAQTYDVDFTASQIGQLQRKRVHHLLTALLNKMNRPLKILEINCGTGEDAIWLASLGHTVVATDASATMIEKAKNKLQNDNNSRVTVSFFQCPFHKLTHVFAQEEFDLVFSNFGGLNCVNESALQQLSIDLASLTKTNGNIFLVLMARHCLWEILYYGIKGKFKTAFRRSRKNLNFVIDEEQVPVYYYSSGEIKKIFGNTFQYQNKKPVGLFIPPSYLEKQFEKRVNKLQQLNRWEEKFSPALLSDLADHYYISFTKITAKK